MTKVHKSLIHWFSKEGFYLREFVKFRDTEGNKHVAYYLSSSQSKYIKNVYEGQRRIRINTGTNTLEYCDGFFDRWANSVGNTLPIPTNKQEFDAIISEIENYKNDCGLDIGELQDELVDLKTELDNDLEQIIMYWNYHYWKHPRNGARIVMNYFERRYFNTIARYNKERKNLLYNLNKLKGNINGS